MTQYVHDSCRWEIERLQAKIVAAEALAERWRQACDKGSTTDGLSYRAVEHGGDFAAALIRVLVEEPTL